MFSYKTFTDSYFINFNFYFAIYNIPFTVRIFPRYEVLLWFENRLISIFEFHFTGGLKIKWPTSVPNAFNKEVTWYSSGLYLYHQIQEPKI